MSDEIHIDDTAYISSKRAAELSGYSQDYIGQLARGGYIDARRVGGLWHVSLASVQEHEKNAEVAKSQQHSAQPVARQNVADIDSIVALDGTDYISASKAAELTGYHQDYVGQLARSGHVASRQVGNRWYVARESILAHKSEKDRLLGAVQAEAVGISRIEQEPSHAQDQDVEETSNHFVYTSDDRPLQPDLQQKEERVPEPTFDDHWTPDNIVPIKVLPYTPSPAVTTGFKPTRPVRRGVVTRRSFTPVTIGLTALAVLVLIIFSAPHVLPSAITSKYMPAKYTGSAGVVFDALGNVIEKIFVSELHFTR